MFLFCIPVDKILHEVARAALDLEIDLCDVLADHADGEQDQSAEEPERNDEARPADDRLTDKMAASAR